MSALFIILLALVLLGYVAVPLALPRQADPLPDERDPLLLELEEEKAALFRAIRELEAREDLPEARRSALRARYEAKAARLLRAIDERQGVLAGRPPPRVPRADRRAPIAALGLLAVMGTLAVTMSAYVLPRVGEGATITTGDLEAGRELRDLQRAAERDPSEATLLALGDAYWRSGDAEGAEQAYLRAAEELEPVPAQAYQRLGLLALQQDMGQALAYLEQAREAAPNDLDTLYALAEVYFAQAQPERALETLGAYLALPEGANDETARARLATMESLAPLLRRATDEPSEANLLALADAYWDANERERAADLYLRVLNLNPHSGTALARLGQMLFLGGQTAEAAEVLARARELGAADADALLFLGNALFGLERYREAIEAWQEHLERVGPQGAGRVPDLIASAEARLAGAAGGPERVGASVSTEGETLFAAHCATCHGAQGQGGSGPPLAGSARARNEANVADAVRHGRGMMPGFGARLSEDELAAILSYVLELGALEGEAQRP